MILTVSSEHVSASVSNLNTASRTWRKCLSATKHFSTWTNDFLIVPSLLVIPFLLVILMSGLSVLIRSWYLYLLSERKTEEDLCWWRQEIKNLSLPCFRKIFHPHFDLNFFLVFFFLHVEIACLFVAEFVLVNVEFGCHLSWRYSHPQTWTAKTLHFKAQRLSEFEITGPLFRSRTGGAGGCISGRCVSWWGCLFALLGRRL